MGSDPGPRMGSDPTEDAQDSDIESNANSLIDNACLYANIET